MSSQADQAATTAREIHAAQVALAYAAQPISLLMVMLIASILVLVLWPALPWQWLVGWWMVTALVSLLRWRLLSAYRVSDALTRITVDWERRFLVGVLASGLSWGAAGLFLFPEGDLPRQAFLCMVLAGMVAGAMSTLSALLPAAVLYGVLTLLPVAVRALLQVEQLANYMGLLVLLFLSVIVIGMRRLHATVKDSLRLRHERNRAQEHADRQAYFDQLTGLPNRRLVRDRLRRELARARRHQQRGALLSLDLDNFKTINDSLGQGVGNGLLVAIAARLRSCSREEDIVARVGADEFVVVLPDLGSTAALVAREARRVAEKLLTLIAEPCMVGDQQLQVSTSIGIALFPDDGRHENDLLKHADTALYQAKRTGRNTFQFFVKRMELAADHRLQIERGLREAVARDELDLYLQPLVDRDGNLKSAEALLRWSHPDGRIVRPAEFIELAEESGLILDIGEWVIHNGCRITQSLLDRVTLPALDYLALNISYKQFRRADFLDVFFRNVESCEVDPSRITMELTESTFITDVKDAIEKMSRLKEHGVRFAIDDFGTGHSSLAYLKKLPVDVIKIDRSFVRHLSSDRGNAAICESIILLGQRFGLQVVAEGVEDRQALDWLVRMGCDTFQGYYFSRPIPVAEFHQRYAAGEQEQADVDDRDSA